MGKEINEELRVSPVSDIINSVVDDSNVEEEQHNPGLVEEIEQITPTSPLLTRRKFLVAAGLLAAATTLGIIAKDKVPFGENIVSPDKKIKDGQMILDQKEEFFQTEMVKVLNWVPDGPITYWTTPEGKRRYLLTGGQDNATYMLETEGKQTLRDVMRSGELTRDSFQKVYSPDENTEHKKHYVGITSVLQMDGNNPDHLLGVAHCEQRIDRNASGTFTATIELLESKDGGLSWAGVPLIRGMEPQAPGEKASGAGQPTAIYNKADGYAYILYIDWAAGKKVQHKDQIYLARIKLLDENSVSLQNWTEDGFATNSDSKLKSVIPVPDNQPDFIYTALPSLSWNEELNQYICTGECDKGFWMSKSKNLTEWSEPEIIYDFTKRGGKPHSILQVGEKWDSYPTALDETKASSSITGRSGIFYHSSGDNVISHEPAAVDFTIKS